MSEIEGIADASVAPTVAQDPQAASTAAPARAEPASVWTAAALWAGALACCAMLATILSMQAWAELPAAEGLIRSTGEAGASGLAEGGYFVIVCLYALVGAAAFSDAALRLIPNRFTYTALILALTLNLVIAPVCELLEWNDALLWIGANASGWGGIALESLKGFGLCFVVGIISFAARGLGGGDVKLLMALGALAGYGLTVSILLNTLAVAAVVGLVNLLCQGHLVRVLQRFFLALYVVLVTKHCSDPKIFGRTESPFCLSLLIAMILLPFVNIHALIMSGINDLLGMPSV